MAEYQKLVEAAVAAMNGAYCPYSNFKVGCAVLAIDGEMFTGANVENAAYPLGSCAEAVALANFANAGKTELAVVVVAGSGPDLCTPCGGCRQRIREFGNNDTVLLICDPTGIKLSTTLGELLPYSFGKENLIK